MQENNQNPVESTGPAPVVPPVAAPVAPAPMQTPYQQAPLSQQTVSGVMGATQISKRSTTNVGVYVGIGIIIIAVVIAGAYFWISRIEPGAAVMEEVAETVVPSDAAELDTLTSEVDGTINFTEVDAILEGIDTELDAALNIDMQ